MAKTKMTDFEKEVIKLVENLDDSSKGDMFRDYSSEDTLEEFSNLGIVVETVEHYGGEDQGKDYFTIFSFKRGDAYAYVKFDGWYASYHGSEFTEAFLVRPQQEVVTVYNTI